jgi:6-pyruvoyl-tetrahydropterin synthase
MRLFVDNLTNIDFSYLCPKRGLVGETWLANVELAGELDHQGMVCDFGIVKKQIRQWLDQHLDHALLVPLLNSRINAVQSHGQTSVTLGLADNRQIHVESPTAAISLIEVVSITPEDVARWCEEQLASLFPSSKITLSFGCEEISSPYYHYSHGLKKHAGACQRIAHGHRSKLLVWRNGILCNELIEEWAKKWTDIYLATKEDCVAETEGHLTFRYQSSQGHFSLSIPNSSCYIIETDTTVEYIAQHLALKISERYPGDDIQVKAFEGIGKGAIATRQGEA